MKYSFTLLYFLLVLTISAGAQNITGIWKGYFVQNNFGFSEERYKFEVQIEQLPNNGLNGVTYSYRTTVFYGKAEAKGIYTKKTNNILLNEIKLVDLKIADQSQPCLMTCYLEYDKMGDIETLTGTYSSRNVKSNSDCGIGKVYLEKSTESDFYKEDFLVKRENELKKKDKSHKTARNNSGKKRAIKPGAEANLISQPTDEDKPVAKNNALKKSVKPKVTEKPVTRSEKKVIPPPPTVNEPKKDTATVAAPPPPVIKTLPKPEVLIKRDNNLVKTITTSAKEFKIELYDNGEIDGDRISVYHNNELIVNNKMLTDKPISFTIHADENSGVHEFVMVAENLGSIPPNTSLMIITAGSKRYELFVTSTEQKNAVVRIEYKKE
ncbi:hypothetical protein [Segetibacter koreensis]|uniref:hypothetical protein n=1 Tax=Segetibacter koreensis TaxID=398037 RepID=UPI000367065B|nr:hypothetical protein [Segetibacter koreensis]